MATAFTSLGLVGLVVGITLSSGARLAGGPGMAPSQERANVPAAASAAAAAEGNGSDRDSYAPMIQSSGDDAALYATNRPPGPVATVGRAGAQTLPSQLAFGAGDGGGRSQPGADAADDLASEESSAAPGPPNPLIAGSLGLLGIGLLLFGLRIASRRVG
jgi:hypothetical protein